VWAKLIYGSLQTATALVDDTIPRVLSDERARGVIAALVREGVHVARAYGFKLPIYDQFDPEVFVDGPPEAITAQFDLLATIKAKQVKQRTGLWRDIRIRRRPTEVDGITGELVRRGEAIGVPVPLNARLVQMIH